MTNSFLEKPIDFVVPWVDGNDLEWQITKDKYLPRQSEKADSRNIRYRDYGLLKYWFRGVENFAPWVNKVYFITNGQLPSWINLDAEKLVCVRHDEYISAEYLPTFSANPIELGLHRIEGLSDQFVYFNDDMFLLQPISTSHFFKKELPVLYPRVSLTVPSGGCDQFPHLMLNNVMLINRHFRASKVIRQNLNKWVSPFKVGFKSAAYNMIALRLGYFTGFYNPHMPSPFLKEVFEEIWMKEEKVLSNTMKQRFRSSDDVTQYIFYDWLLASGRFFPEKREKLGRYFEVSKENDKNDEIAKAISNQAYPVVCINDTDNGMSEQQFEDLKRRLSEAFETILPNKSSFEK